MFSAFEIIKKSKNLHNKYSQCDDTELARAFRAASGKEKLICAEIIQERLLKSYIQETLQENSVGNDEIGIIEDHSVLKKAFDEWKKENIFVGVGAFVVNCGVSAVDSIKIKAQKLSDFRSECDECDDAQLADLFRRKSGLEKNICVMVIKQRIEDGDSHPLLIDVVREWQNRNY